MKKIVWMVSIAAGLALLACSSSKSNGTAFPYSGPSCMSGQPTMTTTTTSTACSTCTQNACSSSATSQCIDTTCSSFFTCFCACQPGTSCILNCPQSSACTSCVTSLSNCYTQAQQTTCASECGATDAGGGSSGGGTSSSSSGGSTATGVCATLTTCCPNIPGGATVAQGCTAIANMNNSTTCQSFLSGLQDAGVCH